MRVVSPLPVTIGGEGFGTGDKTVVRAALKTEGREYGPDKTVVSVETRDGWRYHFQRFRSDEPLVQRNRHDAAGGLRTKRTGRIPQAVERYIQAVEAGDVSVEHDQAVECGDSAHSSPQAALTDGGEQTVASEPPAMRSLSADSLSAGLCPYCEMNDRHQQAHTERQLSAHPVYDDLTPRHHYGDR